MFTSTKVMQVLAEVAVAALVAGGLVSLIRFVEEWLLTPAPLTAALLIRTEQELDNLDLLLEEARRHSLRTGRHRPVVLIDRRLLAYGEDGQPRLEGSVRATVEQYRALCYPVDMTPTEPGR